MNFEAENVIFSLMITHCDYILSFCDSNYQESVRDHSETGSIFDFSNETVTEEMVTELESASDPISHVSCADSLPLEDNSANTDVTLEEKTHISNDDVTLVTDVTQEDKIQGTDAAHDDKTVENDVSEMDGFMAEEDVISENVFVQEKERGERDGKEQEEEVKSGAGEAQSHTPLLGSVKERKTKTPKKGERERERGKWTRKTLDGTPKKPATKRPEPRVPSLLGNVEFTFHF